MSKKRLSAQVSLLREQGIPALGSTVNPNATVNPIGFYSPNREEYKTIWTQYDLNQCCSRYYWEDLPNGLTSWNLERMLYFRGTVCGFKYGGKSYILPYYNEGNINVYGMPTIVRPITYNGQAVDDKPEFFSSENFKLNVDMGGNEIDEYTAVLLFDSIPYSPTSKSPSRFIYNQIIINQLVDVFARININIVVSNKKILIQTKDAKQASIIREELQIAFGSDCPFGVITSPIESNTIQESSDLNADELFNTVKNYDAIRCFMSGISSKGFGAEKKERLVTGELAGAEEEKDLILDMGYELRQLFCDNFNKITGEHISVHKRADDYEDSGDYSTEENGNGENVEEEMEVKV